MQLTQKECSLIKDMTDQEKLCSDKYRKSAKAAADPQLASLFTSLASVEDGHLNTLNEISSGSCPQTNSSGGSGSSGGANSGSAAGSSFTAYHTAETPEKKNDSFLCSDLLSSEKHASHLYDTCIFEFRDDCVRQTLNHIQKQEQEHGKLIYDYMKTNGMYS